MFLEIVKRVLIGAITTILFSLTFAFFAYESTYNRENDSAYISFLGLYILISLYSGPVSIIAGVIWSFIIDALYIGYLYSFICYIIAGVLSSMAFIFLLSEGPISLNKETYSTLGLGVIGSLLYYHILIIWKTRFFRRTLYLH